MRRFMTVLAIFLGLVTPAVSLADEQALQRCVWSCLYGAGKGNAASPAYNACVKARCTKLGGAKAPAVKGDARKGWVTGRDGAGIGYAGVDGKRPNTGLYYFCGRGQSFLRVIGIDGGERGMIIDVDGKQFPLSFRANGRNQPESRQPSNAPVIRALQTGNRVKVLSYELGAIVDGTLRGSKRALAQVISSC